MTYPVRAYVGAGAAGTISNSGGITASFTGLLNSSTSLSSWVSSQTQTLNSSTYIVIAVDYGTATEEKILCTWQSSSSLNIITRGYDGTTAVAHNLGALFIPIWSATEAQEANNAVQSLKPLLQNTGTATVPATVNTSSVNAQGASTIAAAVDHTHALGTIATGITSLTGDVTTPSGSSGATAATLASSGVAAGTYGSSTAIPVVTVDAKGRVTSASTTSVAHPPLNLFTGTTNGSQIALSTSGFFGYSGNIGTVTVSGFTNYMVFVQVQPGSYTGTPNYVWTLTDSNGTSIATNSSFGLTEPSTVAGFSGVQIISNATGTASATITLSVTASASGLTAACVSIYAIGIN